MCLPKINWFAFIELCIAVIVLLILCPLYCIFAVTVYAIIIALSIVFCILSCICGVCDDTSHNSSPCDCKDDECKISCVIDMGNWIKTYYEREITDFTCYYNDVEITRDELTEVVVDVVAEVETSPLPSYTFIDQGHINAQPLSTPLPPPYSNIEEHPQSGFVVYTASLRLESESDSDSYSESESVL